MSRFAIHYFYNDERYSQRRRPVDDGGHSEDPVAAARTSARWRRLAARSRWRSVGAGAAPGRWRSIDAGAASAGGWDAAVVVLAMAGSGDGGGALPGGGGRFGARADGVGAEATCSGGGGHGFRIMILKPGFFW